jgi:hypothetical protein
VCQAILANGQQVTGEAEGEWFIYEHEPVWVTGRPLTKTTLHVTRLTCLQPCTDH